VQCCCYNSTTTPFAPTSASGCCCGEQVECCPVIGTSFCQAKTNYCFTVVVVSSVLVVFVFFLAFGAFYAGR
jgi:hypothetical protein